jgi:hypothetical protein
MVWLVEEIKGHHVVTAMEPRTPVGFWKEYSECICAENAELLFSELLKREYVMSNHLYAKHHSQPTGHLVNIMNSLKLQEIPEMQGVSELSDGDEESETEDCDE